MSIAKLFGFKGSDRKATLLPENVAELFGAKEGEAMEVEATEAGHTAIATAEANLQQIETQLETLQNECNAKDKTIQSLQTSAQENLDQITALEESIATKDARITELEKAPATNHTRIDKDGDAAGNDDYQNELRADEEKAKAFGQRIHEKQSKTKK